MLRRRILALTLLAIATCVAAATDAATARPFRVADQPLEVRKSLSFGPVNCRDVTEGGKVVFAPDTVRKVDFNGDGRADYIVDFTHTKCGEAKHTFCGTGGCMVDFLVTLPNGKLRSVFAGQVHDYEILRSRPRKVRFSIFHNYCPHRTDGCTRDIRIGYRLFTPMY